MSVGMERIVGKPIVVHDFSAHECFERQSCQHVQAEEEASDVDHEVVIWKVVEHVAKRLVAECEIARQRHNETRNQRDARAVVCNAREAVDGRLAKGAVDEEAVVMADESEGDDPNGLEDAVIDDEGATQLALELGGYTERLCYDSHNDDNHAHECKPAGFGKL